MKDEELIKDFWISLRAEEIANENADPELDKQGHWLAFEDGCIFADLEWFANYEGLRVDELDGPLINEALKLLKRWRKDEETTVRRKTLVAPAKGSEPKQKAAQNTTGPKTLSAGGFSIPILDSNHPIFKGGYIVGATRLRNSSPKPVHKKGGSK
jgi:hypothetical protein